MVFSVPKTLKVGIFSSPFTTPFVMSKTTLEGIIKDVLTVQNFKSKETFSLTVIVFSETLFNSSILLLGILTAS